MNSSQEESEFGEKHPVCTDDHSSVSHWMDKEAEEAKSIYHKMMKKRYETTGLDGFKLPQDSRAAKMC